MNFNELKDYLDFKANQYNSPRFIESDPIQIPHKYQLKEDIEISGFLAATIAWGNRKMIINSADKMMQAMGNNPFDFVMNASSNQINAIDYIVHRTFNSEDFRYFIHSLRNIYTHHGGLEGIFSNTKQIDLQNRISAFKKVFFELNHQSRTTKHVSDPSKGSSSKRLNMFLRWLVRNDNKGVDFGIWKSVSPAELSCPLDVHSGNVARTLGILKRKQNDAKALQELDASLRKLDPTDPVKYDFALFGLGVFEGIK
ncbi:TIGR02757 family protein [Flavobacterium sp. CBA20B-1]|uniref:TIGR02757 family protein n=1 Tax=unclassified Flavobacterium TaxID=196869 RepID=UPI002223FC26|nr:MULTISPECIES: TIGR02757 family protein [unclassified Flavobacterium]WCM42612.1 TIGR02757 family protein [Flavobacterium sp. CBA20B-1]